ncbi:PLXB1-like protein, partial [Mya arenaria]
MKVYFFQYSVLEDGSLHKYDTSSVPISSSREDKHIRDLYHFPDGDALYALTNSKISKISLRSCSEIGVSVCTQSEIMKLKDPHCGWCVFKNKLSKKSECIHKWISSVDECITLSISPQGVKVGENTIDIAITSDSLPNRNFTCAIGDIPGNNEMAGENISAIKANFSSKPLDTCNYTASSISCSLNYEYKNNPNSMSEFENDFESKVMGTELGDISQNLSNIEISGKKQGSGDNKPYGYLWDKPDDKSDFDLQVRTGFLYSAKSQSTVNNKLLIFRLGDHEYILFVDFQLKNSSLTDIFPKSGPEVGGTRVTLYGTNLGIGNKVVERIPIGTDGKVQPIGTNAENYTVEFTTKHGTGTLNINFDLNGHRLHNPKDLNFTYLKDPDIMGIEPSKAFLSGGTVMTVTGKDFTNANVGKITLAEFCEITKNRTDEMLCKIPRAPTQVKEQLDDEPSRKKRAADCDGCVSVDIIISLDGVEKSFTLSYYHDPSIYKFGDGVVLFSSEEQYLKIKGDKLDLVATTSDFKITIGVEECSVIEVKDSYMTCKAPRTQPKPEKPGQSLPEVKVSVGNIHTTVGYIQYKQDPNILIIAGASAAAAVFLLVMVITFFVCKYRKVGSKARALEKQLNNLELEIKHVAKEEFLDMQTSMSTVNRNLIEQGFPYHSYQQYACNVMFATDYLMSDPVVSSYKMSDELRARARTGMERFQGLLENKSNFAGNLCAIMMGRMDYMHDYSIRVWAMLIKTPSILFDINAPSYVSESLDVISQVFIESFSRTEQAVSKNQQETTFNKNAALYRLYEQIKPYTDEILDDLSICQETRCLQLNKNLK